MIKISEQSDIQMTLVDRPWFIYLSVTLMGSFAALNAAFGHDDLNTGSKRVFVLLVGLVFVAIAHWYMPFSTHRFDRKTGYLSQHLHRVTGTRSKHIPLTDIEWAKVEVRWSKNSRGERVVLKLKDRTFPLETGYSSRKSQPVADAINEWLTDPGDQSNAAPTS